MDPQLSNALSTMSIRRLVMLLHFETHVLENPQKEVSSDFHIYELDFLPHCIYLNNTFTVVLLSLQRTISGANFYWLTFSFSVGAGPM